MRAVVHASLKLTDEGRRVAEEMTGSLGGTPYITTGPLPKLLKQDILYVSRISKDSAGRLLHLTGSAL
jgi:hypothetical protein